MEIQVRTRNEYEPKRATHFLESPDGEKGQDTKAIRASKGRSQTGEPRRIYKLGHRRNATNMGALTF